MRDGSVYLGSGQLADRAASKAVRVTDGGSIATDGPPSCDGGDTSAQLPTYSLTAPVPMAPHMGCTHPTATYGCIEVRPNRTGRLARPRPWRVQLTDPPGCRSAPPAHPPPGDDET